MPIEAAGQGLVTPLQNLIQAFINILPGIIFAIILLVVGYLIAFLLGHAVKVVLERLGLDRQVAKAKLTKGIGHTNLSSLTGEVTKWFIFLIFIREAVQKLSLGTISDILEVFVRWIPHVIAAGLIALVGIIVAHYVEMKIVEHSKVKGIDTLAKAIKVVIVLTVLILALGQIGVNTRLLENLILLVVGAFAVGIALAIGIGLGLGSKGEVQSIIKNLKKYF